VASTLLGHHNCHGGDRIGSGPFTTNTPLMNAVLLDIFFAVISVTGSDLGGGGRGTRTRRGRTGKDSFVSKRKRKRDFALPRLSNRVKMQLFRGHSMELSSVGTEVPSVFTDTRRRKPLESQLPFSSA